MVIVESSWWQCTNPIADIYVNTLIVDMWWMRRSWTVASRWWVSWAPPPLSYLQVPRRIGLIFIFFIIWLDHANCNLAPSPWMCLCLFACRIFCVANGTSASLTIIYLIPLFNPILSHIGPTCCLLSEYSVLQMELQPYHNRIPPFIPI